MSEGVRPALTPEEWAEGVYEGADGLMVHLWPHDATKLTVYIADAIDEGEGAKSDAGATIGPPDCLALAALALQRAGPDGKPLFTLDDLRMIQRHAYDVCDVLWLDFFDRVASLLPPAKP